MTQEELVKAIAHAVTLYINAPEYFDENPQLRINPATFDVVAINGKDMLEGIADNEEAIEDEAQPKGMRLKMQPTGRLLRILISTPSRITSLSMPAGRCILTIRLSSNLPNLMSDETNA